MLFATASPPPAEAIAIFPGNKAGSMASVKDASIPLAFHTPLKSTPTFPFVLNSAIKFPLSSVVCWDPFAWSNFAAVLNALANSSEFIVSSVNSDSTIFFPASVDAIIAFTI